MAQKYLVRTMVGEGARLLLHLALHNFPISAASWIYTEEFDDWELRLATSVVDFEGQLEAYVKMHELMTKQTPQFAIERDAVTLKRSKDPLLTELARAAAQLRRNGVAELRDSRVDGFFVDAALVYSPVPKTQDDLTRIFV